MAGIELQQAEHPPKGFYPRSIISQQHVHVPHDAMMSPTAIRGQLDGQWNPEHVTRPAIRNGAEQDALQDPEHITMANYGITDYPGQPGVPAVPYRDMPHNMGPAQYVPEHENVDLPQNNDSGHGPRGAVLDPTSYQAAFPHPSTHRTSVLSQPAVENLRRLASRCIGHPDSQVDVVRVEPGTTG